MPDVEKIIGEFANNAYEEDKLRKVIAQARAPLVAALRRVPELAYEVIHEQGSSITLDNLPNELQCICDDALTGTAEK